MGRSRDGNGEIETRLVGTGEDNSDAEVADKITRPGAFTS